ncbi:MAG: hypothetical protein ABW051_10890 [Burkholderiaceae bacterium]
MARFQHHLQVEDFAASTSRETLEDMVRGGQMDKDSERVAREWLDIDGELVSRHRWMSVLVVCVVLVAAAVAAAPFMA